MPTSEVRIEGLRELQRALSKVNREIAGEVRDELKAAGEPVRQTAESLAGSRIQNIGGFWSQMRLGATMRTVYVAPRARRRGGSPRPNLAGLLLNQAMLPALRQHQGEIARRVGDAFDRLARRAGFH